MRGLRCFLKILFKYTIRILKITVDNYPGISYGIFRKVHNMNFKEERSVFTAKEQSNAG